MLSLLLSVLFIGLLIAMFLAPLEALGWYAGWYGEGLSEPTHEEEPQYLEFGPSERHDHYVVFLDGIAKVGAENYEDVQSFLDKLSDARPATVVLGDIMPYSPRNLALTEGRPLAPFWRYALEMKLQGRRPILAFSINMRNLFQVGVAADRRYGPIYGQGEAQVILNSLIKAGYEQGSGVPITIIGYSGGAQIAVLAAPFLRRALDAPVSLISLGGIVSSDRGLMELHHYYELRGSKDRVAQLGNLIFPGKWPFFPHSYWNRIRRRGKPVRVQMGPMKHHQAGSYLDDDSEIDGRNHQDITVDTVRRLLERIDRDTQPREIELHPVGERAPYADALPQEDVSRVNRANQQLHKQVRQ